MKNLEEYLGIFKLKKNGESFSLAYDQLCDEIHKLSPTVPAYEIVSKLDQEKYLVTLPNGGRELSPLGLKKRIPLAMQTPSIVARSDPQAWNLFRQLCRYYSDCVQNSEKSQEFLLLSSLNIRFLIPALGHNWLGNERTIDIVSSPEQLPALNRIRARMSEDEEVYVGYPVFAGTSRNDRTGSPLWISPVLLFPVDVLNDIHKISIKIRFKEASINQTWIEYNIPREERAEFNKSIYNSSGTDGLLEVRAAIQAVANKLKVRLDPNTASANDFFSVGIKNTAVMFVGSALKYSKNLKKELKYIASQPPETLDKTALAYVFRDPPLENRFSTVPDCVPVDFIECNSEQRVALKQGLTAPASRVKGPPGTGKSQVAVNLIANLVFAGRSVLFTSRNHRALSAIVEKVGRVSDDFPLVQFCSADDGRKINPWWKLDLDALCDDFIRARSDVLRRGVNEQCAEEIVIRASEDICDTAGAIAEVEKLRADIQEIEAAREYIKNVLLHEEKISEEQLTEAFAMKIEKFPRTFSM